MKLPGEPMFRDMHTGDYYSDVDEFTSDQMESIEEVIVIQPTRLESFIRERENKAWEAAKRRLPDCWTTMVYDSPDDWRKSKEYEK